MKKRIIATMLAVLSTTSISMVPASAIDNVQDPAKFSTSINSYTEDYIHFSPQSRINDDGTFEFGARYEVTSETFTFTYDEAVFSIYGYVNSDMGGGTTTYGYSVALYESGLFGKCIMKHTFKVNNSYDFQLTDLVPGKSYYFVIQNINSLVESTAYISGYGSITNYQEL